MKANDNVKLDELKDCEMNQVSGGSFTTHTGWIVRNGRRFANKFEFATPEKPRKPDGPTKTTRL